MQTTERNRAQTSTRFLRASSGNPFATQNSFFHRHSSDPKLMSHSHSLLRTFFSRSYRCGSTGFHDPKLWIKKDKLKRTKGFMRDFAWMNGGELLRVNIFYDRQHNGDCSADAFLDQQRPWRIIDGNNFSAMWFASGNDEAANLGESRSICCSFHRQESRFLIKSSILEINRSTTTAFTVRIRF